MKKPTIKRKSTILKVVKPKTISLPTQLSSHTHTKCAKSKQAKNTSAYYHCLANACQGKNITKACADCKKNSLAFTKSRQKEILNIKNAWKEITISLGKLTPKH